MLEILLYFLLQNSGQPLQGTVFVAAGPVLVELAIDVPLVLVAPPINVSSCEVLVRLDCESVAEAVSVPFVVVDSTVLCPV
jgi:hypothetical protein